MTKAGTKPNTNSRAGNGKHRGPDAEFYDMIARRTAEWRKALTKKTPGGEAEAEACNLEFEIAAARVATPSGFHAKCKTVAADSWDADDMVVIGFFARPRRRAPRHRRRARLHPRPDGRSLARQDGGAGGLVRAGL